MRRAKMISNLQLFVSVSHHLNSLYLSPKIPESGTRPLSISYIQWQKLNGIVLKNLLTNQNSGERYELVHYLPRDVSQDRLYLDPSN